MLQRLPFFRFFLETSKPLGKVFHPPIHLRVHEVGSNIDDCLRRLEKAAKLPEGDLYTTVDTHNVTTWPVERRAILHVIRSRTADTWPKEKGYISGSVTEFTEKGELSSIQKQRINLLTCGAVMFANKIDFFAKLHMSKNCPGVYKDNICMTCGDVSR